MAQVQESLEEQQEAMPSNDPAYEAWFRRQVEAGLRDVREGRVLSAEKADAEMEAFIEELSNNPDAFFTHSQYQISTPKSLSE